MLVEERIVLTVKEEIIGTKKVKTEKVQYRNRDTGTLSDVMIEKTSSPIKLNGDEKLAHFQPKLQLDEWIKPIENEFDKAKSASKEEIEQIEKDLEESKKFAQERMKAYEKYLKTF